MRWRLHLAFARALAAVALLIGAIAGLGPWIVVPAALVVIVSTLADMVYCSSLARKGEEK